MRAGAFIGCMLALWAGLLPAQDLLPSGIIFTELEPDLVILLDGEAVRPAQGDTVFVPVGRHVLESIDGDRYTWSECRISDTLEVLPGAFLHVRIPWGRSHVIRSQPERAEVYDGGLRLGVTPFLFRQRDARPTTLTVRSEGFLPRDIQPMRSVEYVFLLPETGHRPEAPQVLEEIEPVINNRTLTFVSAVVMVGSSVAAAYLKEKANRSLDEYQRTGSAAALQRVRRYDNYSAVAAATMVVSFTGFALFLTGD